MRSRHPSGGLAARSRLPSMVTLGLLASTGLAGCEDRRPDVTKVYPGPHLAALVESSEERARFDTTSTGTLAFSLESKAGSVRGTLPVQRGWLAVDAQNLESLEGSVRFDASRVELTETVPPLDVETARRILGISADAPLNDAASFSITDVISATPRQAQAGKRERGPSGEEIRTSVVRVRGDLEVHGHRAQREVSLELAFSYSSGAPGTVPDRVRVRAAQPVRLELAPFGIQAASSAPALDGLLEVANVGVDLGFIARRRALPPDPVAP